MPGDYHYGWLSAGLHLSGSNGSTSFPDVKGNAFARQGSVAISTAQSRFSGEGSAYFPGGVNDRILGNPSARYDLGGGSLSISFSAFFLGLPTENHDVLLVGIGTTGSASAFTIGVGYWGGFNAYVPIGIPVPAVTQSNVIALNTWQDWELSIFNGNSFWLRNGVLNTRNSGVTMPSAGSSNRILLGCDDSMVAGIDGRFYGHLSNLRVMCASGRHAGDYSPDTAPFPETMELHAIANPGVEKAVSKTVPSARSVLLETIRKGVDVEHGGHGRVIGSTKNTGAPDYPVARRVRLLRKRDGVLAGETWSDGAGNYGFLNVRHDIDYMVLSHDHTGLYNGVIADSITPELMP